MTNNMKKNIYIVPAVDIHGLITEATIAATVECNTTAGSSLSNESQFDDEDDFMSTSTSLWDE